MSNVVCHAIPSFHSPVARVVLRVYKKGRTQASIHCLAYFTRTSYNAPSGFQRAALWLLTEYLPLDYVSRRDVCSTTCYFAYQKACRDYRKWYFQPFPVKSDCTIETAMVELVEPSNNLLLPGASSRSLAGFRNSWRSACKHACTSAAVLSHR